MSHVLWLSAHISAASFILLQISSLCSPSLLYSSTNTSGLTLFCTWLTARCLKYFPVCSRINCSSGNDDSSKKQKKRKEQKKRTETELGGEKRKVIDRNMFCFWCFFFLFLYFCAWVSRLKMMKILIKYYDRSPLAWWYPQYAFLFSVISRDLWTSLDLNAALRNCWSCLGRAESRND